MANAHEGARRVDAHGVFPAVVLSLGALVDIWEGGGEVEENRSQASRGIERKEEKNSFLSFLRSRQSEKFPNSLHGEHQRVDIDFKKITETHVSDCRAQR